MVGEHVPIGRGAEPVRPDGPGDEIRSPQRRIPQPELVVNAELAALGEQDRAPVTVRTSRSLSSCSRASMSNRVTPN